MHCTETFDCIRSVIVPGSQLVVGAELRDEIHSPSVQRCKQMPEALGCIKSVIVIVPGSQMVVERRDTLRISAASSWGILRRFWRASDCAIARVVVGFGCL